MNILNNAVSSRELLNTQIALSNSAHQREVADLKAAGLNPVLSSGGNGASTPSGASDRLSDILGAVSDIAKNSGKALNTAVSALANGEKKDVNGEIYSESNPITGNLTLGRQMKEYAAGMNERGSTRVFGVQVSNKYIASTLDRVGNYLIAHENDVPSRGTSAYNAYKKAIASGRAHSGSYGNF